MKIFYHDKYNGFLFLRGIDEFVFMKILFETLHKTSENHQGHAQYSIFKCSMQSRGLFLIAL